MKRFARLLIVTFGFGVLGFAMSLVPQKNATGAPGVGGAPVTVNNTASNPVPVTGNVSVGNFPATLTGSTVPVSGSVSANVTFPSSIGVTGGPVNVANTAATPIFNRNADNPANEPFVATLCAGVAINCGGTQVTSFTVPTADANSAPVRRLVIEYYSAICFEVTPPDIPLNTLFIFTGGHQNFFYIGPLLLSANASTGSFYYANQQTQIYADPGSSVQLDFLSLGGSPTCDFTITGYLVLQ